MKQGPSLPTSSWNVFKALWHASRRRAVGRQLRQAQLMHRKTSGGGDPVGSIGNFLAYVFMVVLHGALAWMAIDAAKVATWLQIETQGMATVGPSFAFRTFPVVEQALAKAKEDVRRGGGDVVAHEKALTKAQFGYDNYVDRIVSSGGRWRARHMGGSENEQEVWLRKHIKSRGSEGLYLEGDPKPVLHELAVGQTAFWSVASFLIAWWLLMMVFQGEGLELDVQRRRHPMWEWLLSHPVRPVAAFSAEMLAPMFSNPIYLTAPVFWILLFRHVYPLPLAILAGCLVGWLWALGAACCNKALEAALMLRLSPRTKGAALGLMSWLGYAAIMLPALSMGVPRVKYLLVSWMDGLPWAWVGMVSRSLWLGFGADPSIAEAVVTCSTVGVSLLGMAVGIAWWGFRKGLQSASGASVQSAESFETLVARPSRWGWKPAYRKEVLWFLRDRSAIIQVFLIPLTIGAFQAFHLRGIAEALDSSWSRVCGIGIICGVYFLLVLGPRSLASEGAALWISLTWPRGLEALLQAKARLWWMLSSAVVMLVFLVAGVQSPADWWRIALVAVGWLMFSRGLAEKAVTLATAPSSSGEAEPTPAWRRWAVMLGTFTFAGGVIAQDWHTAVIGVVFSSMMSAAMWQNFRARIPYFFDSWSEKLPRAPTLMHSMIAIVLLVEVVAIVTSIARAFAGPDTFGAVLAITYGSCGFLAWWTMENFLAGRDVKRREIWRWPQGGADSSLLASLKLAVGCGIVLGSLALGYLWLLHQWPATHEQLVSAQTTLPRFWLFVLAVGMAPFAEEYFFRGLLYRALDGEWGGAKALLGSAAFFAIYHPPLSWVPVFCLGLTAAWLFKRTGRLLPCVLLHMVYNAIVLS